MRPGKTIFFIDHSPKVGGASTVLLNLIKALDAREINPVVVCPASSELRSYFSGQNIPVKLAVMPWFTKRSTPLMWCNYTCSILRFAVFVRRLQRETPASLIHANGFIAALYAILPAKLLRIPLVWHAHEMLERGLLESFFMRLAGRNADRIICVSEAVKVRLAEFGVTPGKCRVLYNFLSERPDPPGGDFRGEYGIPRHATLVGMIGNISHLKGQMILVEAARTLADRHPDSVYVIIGDIISPVDQPYKDELSALVTAAGLKNRVLFTGFRKDAFSIMREIDILVHPVTLPEAFGLVILEAMHRGKPVVASAIGGIPEIVVDGETGILVPPKDPHALAGALDRLLKDPDLGLRLGMAGRRVLSDRFVRDNFVKTLNDIYQELLPEGPAA